MSTDTMPRLLGRFASVGGVCAAAYLAMMAAADAVGLHYALALAVAFPSVLVLGYVLHLRYSFRSDPSRIGFVAYAFAMSANLTLSAFVLFLVCGLGGMANLVGAAISTVAMFSWNFATARWVFSSPKALHGRSEEPERPLRHQSRQAIADPASPGLRPLADRSTATPAVAMVTHYFEARRGGVEIAAGALGRELAGHGCRVVWLATGEEPDLELRERLSTVRLEGTNLIERLLGVPFPLPWPRALGRISDAVRGSNVTIVHDALYFTSVAAFFAARWHARPVVIIQHIGAVPYRSGLLRGLMRLANRVIARPLLRRADRVVFISATTAAHFADLRFASPPKLIFNGLDATLFRPATDFEEQAALRSAFGLPTERRIALFIGRFVEKKGLSALRHVATSQAEITFVFVGSGPLDPSAWQLGNVITLGQRDRADVARLYRVADLLLLPSVGEGLPLVLQEALASGLPVLCGDDTARADPFMPALVQGIHVEPDNPVGTAERLSAAMRDAFARPASTEQRQEAAALARDRYGWPVLSQRYMDLLTGLLRRHADSEHASTTITRGTT